MLPNPTFALIVSSAKSTISLRSSVSFAPPSCASLSRSLPQLGLFGQYLSYAHLNVVAGLVFVVGFIVLLLHYSVEWRQLFRMRDHVYCGPFVSG